MTAIIYCTCDEDAPANPSCLYHGTIKLKKEKTPPHLFDAAYDLYDLVHEMTVVITDLCVEHGWTSDARKSIERAAEVVRDCDGDTRG